MSFPHRTRRARFMGHDESGQALYVAPKDHGPVERRRDGWGRVCRAKREARRLREFRQQHREREP